MNYYIIDGSVENGPIPEEMVRQMLAGNKISRMALIRQGEDGCWQPLQNLTEFLPVAEILNLAPNSVYFACPNQNCKARYQVDDLENFSRKMVQCSVCKQNFLMPDLLNGKRPQAEEEQLQEEITREFFENFPDDDNPYRAGRSTILCPHCWKSFTPGEELYIAVHPAADIDPVVRGMEKIRFKPVSFNNDGKPLDSFGVAATEMACPRCHLRIPQSYLEMPADFFSIVGASSSGKSYFLTCMVHMLRISLPKYFGVTISDLDARLNETVTKYEEKLFMPLNPEKLTALPATELAGDGISDRIFLQGTEVDLPMPFCFEFRDRRGITVRNLTFYDNAGEMFAPKHDDFSNQATYHLSHASGIMFLFDPSNDAAMLNHICDKRDPQVSLKPRVANQEQLLTEMINRIRRHANLSAADNCDIPLVVAVGKYDLWREHFRRQVSAMPAAEGNDGFMALDMEQILDISFSLREFMLEYAPSLVSTAESFFNTVYFVPVSSFGTLAQADEEVGIGVIPQQISPVWVEVPMLLLLARNGLLPEAEKNTSPTGTLAAAISNNKIVFTHPKNKLPVRLPLNYAGAVIDIDGKTYRLPQARTVQTANSWD